MVLVNKYLINILLITALLTVSACQETDRVDYDAIRSAEACVRESKSEDSLILRIGNKVSNLKRDMGLAYIVEHFEKQRSNLNDKIKAIEKCRESLDSDSLYEFDQRGYYDHYSRLKQLLGAVEVALDWLEREPDSLNGILIMLETIAEDLKTKECIFWREKIASGGCAALCVNIQSNSS